MPVSGSLFADDEELAKKDDDYIYSKRGTAASWQPRRAPLRKNVKKLLIGLGIVVLVYYFIKNIPTDMRHQTLRPHYPSRSKPDETGVPIYKNDQSTSNQGSASGPKGSAPGPPPTGMAEDNHYFSGPIKFYQLAASLNTAALATNGQSLMNRNIVFGAASLKSAAKLIPLACEMALHKRNNVHFAMLGRDPTSMEMLKAVNSVDAGCDITFHDARPDFAEFSTDLRMQTSSSAGLGHINNFLHPQAVIVDKSETEEVWMLKAWRDRSALLGKTLIELPKNAAQDIMWFTRLDSWSLNAWNKISFDIIIHAQPSVSGSLIRLLTSLWKADYFSSAPPRLTIELPHKVDEPTEQFLRTFQWPPSHQRSDANANQLTLHHRIPHHGLTAEENSLRLVESFWPTNPATSHVLVLSPHVEISPLYFQYLKYMILEHHYSASAFASPTKLLGISLDLPATYLNDTTAFSPPSNSPFLWQAPNSNAALYFGGVWQELHSFISHSINSAHTLPTPTTLNAKHVSKTYPAWLEHILNLAKVRGYTMLYPRLSSENEALATIHHDLYQAPEEYSYAMNPDHKPIDKEEPLPDITKEFITDSQDHLSLSQTETQVARKNLDIFLPDASVQLLEEMQALSWDGRVASPIDTSQYAMDFAAVFRREIGGCSESERLPQPKPGEARDLFCFDREDDDWEEVQETKGRGKKYAGKEDGKTLAKEPPVSLQEPVGIDKVVKEDEPASKQKLAVEEKANPKPTPAPPVFPDNGVVTDEWKQRHMHGVTKLAETGQ